MKNSLSHSQKMSNTQKKQHTDDSKALVEQIRVWRHNRKLYPGWLVAPYQTREKVWAKTIGWLTTAVRAAETWPAAHSILLWRELSWRFGICLQVLPDEIINQIQTATDELEKLFQNIVNREQLAISDYEDWPTSLIPSNIELREDWIECNLVQLGAFRIRPDINAFRRVAEKLLGFKFLSQDQRSCILYHSCLAALSELDRDRVTTLIEVWPNHPDDPYWLVRKSGRVS